MDSGRTYYNVLGVEEDASQKEIREAFRDLVKEKHPDQNSNSRGEFLQIKEAYEVLSDQTDRARYDDQLSRMRKGRWDQTRRSYSGPFAEDSGKRSGEKVSQWANRRESIEKVTESVLFDRRWWKAKISGSCQTVRQMVSGVRNAAKPNKKKLRTALSYLLVTVPAFTAGLLYWVVLFWAARSFGVRQPVMTLLAIGIGIVGIATITALLITAAEYLLQTRRRLLAGYFNQLTSD